MLLCEKEKNQSTKEKILLATIDASVKKIKNPYSLCNIAMDVGISKPAIFKYFYSKECLIKAALSKAFDDVAKIYNEVKYQFENDIKKIIECISLWLLKNPSHLVFILNQFMMEKDFSSKIVAELGSRGVKLKKEFLSKEGIKEIYSISSIVTLIICLLQSNKKLGEEVSENQLENFVKGISSCICDGIKMNSECLSFDYEKLDILCEEGKNQFLKESRKNFQGDEKQGKQEQRFFCALASAIKKYSFSGITIEKLAKEAGLAKSSLYTWYKNKDELLEKVISAKFVQLKDLLEHNINLVKNSNEKVYVILKTEMDWLLENASVLPVAAWLNFSGNGAINVGQIVLSESNWTSNLFLTERFGLEDSILLASWLICLPVPLVLEGSSRDYSKDFILKSVKYIHSMLWNGILHTNKES